MKWLTFEIQREPGFRLNLIDLILIGLLLGLSIGACIWLPRTSIYAVPLYVGLTFFLFCNVFRIGNRLEPLWYIPFVLCAAYSIHTVDLHLFWALVLLVMEPLKWMLILYTLARPGYHGLGYVQVRRWRDRISPI